MIHQFFDFYLHLQLVGLDENKIIHILSTVFDHLDYLLDISGFKASYSTIYLWNFSFC